MNLYILPPAVMLAHSGGWLSTREVYDVLAADPLGRAMLNKLRLAHDDLSERQHYRSSIEKEIARLTEDLVGLDGIHDGNYRGLYYYLTALSCACKDPDKAQEYLDMRDLLLPEGLSVVNRSYMGQAGGVVELERRVTPDVRAKLAAMPFDGRTLADLVDELIEVGETMGKLTQKRTSLVASMGRDGSESEGVDINASRRRWVNTVGALLKAMELMTVPIKTRELIIPPLEKSIREAVRARQNRDELPGDDVDPEPSEGELPNDGPGDVGLGDGPAANDEAARDEAAGAEAASAAGTEAAGEPGRGPEAADAQASTADAQPPAEPGHAA